MKFLPKSARSHINNAVPQYALCERVTATPTSAHHVRALTGAGMFTSGGADTPALCGAKVAWDTSMLDLADLPGIVERGHATFHLCPACVQVLADTHFGGVLPGVS
jgi:hypothetical protein